MPISARYPLVETLVALLLSGLYLLAIARSRTDPLEGDLFSLMAWLFGAFLLATLLLTALLIGLDRRAHVQRTQAAVSGPSGSR
jgi:hypothetical protein